MGEYLKIQVCRVSVRKPGQNCTRLSVVSIRHTHTALKANVEALARWCDAIRTLAKFHRIPPASVRLSSFGKHSGFYGRQVQLFKSLCEAQANTRDVETKRPVGKIPHFDEMITYFEEQKTQPQDRASFIHGDYKIDNIVFHKTEPKVIGLLESVDS